MNRPDKLFVLGLTGPTGAGKSAVAGMLAAAGLPVLDADKSAREVVEPGSPCLAALARAFSPDILRPDGTLDRKRLAALAFQDDASAKKLSAVTHPAIIARSLARLQEWEAAGCRAAVVDAPLLYESGGDRPGGLASEADSRAGRHHRARGAAADGRAAGRGLLSGQGCPAAGQRRRFGCPQAAGGRAAGLYKPSDIRQKGVRP